MITYHKLLSNTCLEPSPRSLISVNIITTQMNKGITVYYIEFALSAVEDK